MSEKDYDYITYCEEKAQSMYPEIYHKINEDVQKICDREEKYNSDKMFPFPEKETIDAMVEEIYQIYVPKRGSRMRRPYGYGGGFRDLITILLLGGLLGRRRRGYPPYRRPRYDYPSYGYPGYRYPRY